MYIIQKTIKFSFTYSVNDQQLQIDTHQRISHSSQASPIRTIRRITKHNNLSLWSLTEAHSPWWGHPCGLGGLHKQPPFWGPSKRFVERALKYCLGGRWLRSMRRLLFQPIYKKVYIDVLNIEMYACAHHVASPSGANCAGEMWSESDVSCSIDKSGKERSSKVSSCEWCMIVYICLLYCICLYSDKSSIAEDLWRFSVLWWTFFVQCTSDSNLILKAETSWWAFSYKLRTQISY